MLLAKSKFKAGLFLTLTTFLTLSPAPSLGVTHWTSRRSHLPWKHKQIHSGSGPLRSGKGGCIILLGGQQFKAALGHYIWQIDHTTRSDPVKSVMSLYSCLFAPNDTLKLLQKKGIDILAYFHVILFIIGIILFIISMLLDWVTKWGHFTTISFWCISTPKRCRQ